MPIECTPDLFGFARVEGRAVAASFDGGRHGGLQPPCRSELTAIRSGLRCAEGRCGRKELTYGPAPAPGPAASCWRRPNEAGGVMSERIAVRGLGLLAADFGPGYLAQDIAGRHFLYRGDMTAE